MSDINHIVEEGMLRTGLSTVGGLPGGPFGALIAGAHSHMRGEAERRLAELKGETPDPKKVYRGGRTALAVVGGFVPGVGGLVSGYQAHKYGKIKDQIQKLEKNK